MGIGVFLVLFRFLGVRVVGFVVVLRFKDFEFVVFVGFEFVYFFLFVDVVVFVFLLVVGLFWLFWVLGVVLVLIDLVEWVVEWFVIEVKVVISLLVIIIFL